MVVQWIKTNCPCSIQQNKLTGEEEQYFTVFNEDLEQARFNFRDVSEKALDIGSQVHEAIEKYFLTDTYPILDGQAEQAFHAFLGFKEVNDMIPIKIEEKVYSDCWAGTLDFYGYFNEKIYVIDFKSSKAIYLDSMGPQIAAYRSLKPEAVGSGILRLDKETGLPEFKDTTKRYDRDLAVFNAMVDLYFLRHPRIAKQAGK
jgi:hypothetical protein